MKKVENRLKTQDSRLKTQDIRLWRVYRPIDLLTHRLIDPAKRLTFCVLCLFFLVSLARAEDQMAVTSTGEVNAKDNDAGTLITGTTADLILTVIADMSQAEPWEMVQLIQITMPNGFSAKEDAVTSVAKVVREEKTPISGFKSVVDRDLIIITLPEHITLTTTFSIEFTVDASTSAGLSSFTVSLLDISQTPMLSSIDPGNADGRVNNDSLTVKVVIPTKPQPPSDLSVRPNASGENDLIVSWTKSADPLVGGYQIYPSDRRDKPIDITSREQTSYTDRGLEAGKEYSYTVTSYIVYTTSMQEEKKLESDESTAKSAIAPEDTQDPGPPTEPKTDWTQEGIVVTWKPSPSLDVVKYVIYRESSSNPLGPIDEVDADTSTYTDESAPAVGSFFYVVGVVDDAGREARSSRTQLRVASADAKPYPNPFTPLSADPEYNQITFPAAIVKGAEGGIFAIKIYDLEGDLVFQEETDSKEILWDGKDHDHYVDSGIYVYQATIGDKHRIGTVIVAK